ncbi:serine hydrolase [Rhizocola hellebori]|uniref:Serine hydrolase n=1 Tax=Rhizocola hellebori TaxID=1392758 RepID=A0A8J3VLU7_9ACTN|nr:serine hydrolase domain-containing protein [Rhizocola hellebori]GIH11052.1 serine hydrolase [Rhizocola hellebori]
MVLKVDVPSDLVAGDVDEGYGAVADAFRRNFAQRGEIGAACAVYRDGRKVVDLWGGYRDGIARAPWRSDTMVNVFSTTKGVASLALALAHSRGLLDYDQPVAAYWPQFAQAGKADVTVRQLLSHQAGLCAIDQPLSLADLADLDVVAQALAAQRPAWAPGKRHGYHAISLGWYEGELLRRVDPKSRSLGRFFAEEIAGPLGLHFHIGLPDDTDPQRLARIHGFKPAEMLGHLNAMPWRFVAGFLNPRSITARSFANPKVLAEADNYNLAQVRRLELPAANGTGEARAVAQLYGAVASEESKLGLAMSTLAALTRPARPPSGGLRDMVLGVDSVFSLGYIKPFPRFRFGGSEERAFGTPGAGGSFGFADPQTGIGFAYTMNRMGFHLWDDPRELALRDALYRTVLGERSQRPS